MSATDPTDPELKRKRARLRRASRSLPGHRFVHPADELERVAAWCRENDVDPDGYGEGEFLQSFERRVAELFGFESARFMPSGTMAQQVAMRVWCSNTSCAHFGMHPTSHLELHEQRGYSHLHGLRATLVGPAGKPILAEHLRAIPERLAALIVELPAREIGGQLPSWEELEALGKLTDEWGVRLHLDGARIWEASAFYERSLYDIAELFDSAYVSFYKGIGALPGSMLLGPEEFIEEAAVWQKRQGGNLYTLLPSAASAAMRLEPMLARMPEFRRRAIEVAGLLGAIDGVSVLPDPPQVNMFHLILDVSSKRLAEARDRVAEERGLWLVNGAVDGEAPNTSRTEVSIGDSAMDLDDAEIVQAFEHMLELARS